MSGRVLIVGGGYVGSELARSLDPIADVTLIEEREAFSHAPAMIRAVTDPSLVSKALFSYERLLQRGQVVRGRAASVDGSGVTLEDGTFFAGDVIVLATGSSYAAPFKPSGNSIEGLRTANAETFRSVTAANHIAIVGGGAVGTELAGEIKSVMPAKSVTLVSGLPGLMPDYPAKLGSELARKLALLGVDVVHGERALDLPTTDCPFSGDLTLSSGRIISADLVIPTTGSTPETTLLASLPGVRIAEDGRVSTDRWMRPSELENVFTAGDAAANGDAMTIVGASRQTPWLARTIRAVLSGKTVKSQPTYSPWSRAPILLPLGEHLGNSYLPVGVVGNTATRLIKGKTLFIPKYRKLFRTP